MNHRANSIAAWGVGALAGVAITALAAAVEIAASDDHRIVSGQHSHGRP